MCNDAAQTRVRVRHNILPPAADARVVDNAWRLGGKCPLGVGATEHFSSAPPPLPRGSTRRAVGLCATPERPFCPASGGRAGRLLLPRAPTPTQTPRLALPAPRRPRRLVSAVFAAFNTPFGPGNSDRGHLLVLLCWTCVVVLLIWACRRAAPRLYTPTSVPRGRATPAKSTASSAHKDKACACLFVKGGNQPPHWSISGLTLFRARQEHRGTPVWLRKRLRDLE